LSVAVRPLPGIGMNCVAVGGGVDARHHSWARLNHRPAYDSAHYLTFGKTLAPRMRHHPMNERGAIKSFGCASPGSSGRRRRTVGVRIVANFPASTGEIGARRTVT
jgi:hypothetical protein